MGMKLLDKVADKHVFVLKNGQRLSRLEELKNAMKNMNDSVFAHHVTDNRNDFSNWVKNIYGDNKLAESILQAKSQLEIVDVINNRISKFMRHAKLKPKKIESSIKLENNYIKQKINNSKVNKQNKKKLNSLKVKNKNNNDRKTIKSLKEPIMIKLEDTLKKEVVSKFSGKKLNTRKNMKKKHKLDNVANVDFMKIGAYDFFKGVLVGIIIGALLSRAIV